LRGSSVDGAAPLAGGGVGEIMDECFYFDSFRCFTIGRQSQVMAMLHSDVLAR
jgi:hypothetical protein